MDIVPRLRRFAELMRPSGLGGFGSSLAWTENGVLDNAADEIERLRTYNDNAREAYGAKVAELVEACAEIERLLAALKPFAEVAEEWDGEPASLVVNLLAYDGRLGPNVAVESFRRAREAIAVEQSEK